MKIINLQIEGVKITFFLFFTATTMSRATSLGWAVKNLGKFKFFVIFVNTYPGKTVKTCIP